MSRSKKAPKGPLTRCGGTMTEAQYLAWIRSALRSKWLRWKPRADALKAAQVPYKGPNARQKYSYQCAVCEELFSQKETEVDHFPKDAGSILSVEDIGEFVNNLYCEQGNLRVVCKPCHAAYTLSQRNGISFEEALFQKAVTEVMKSKNLVDWLQQRGYSGQSISNADKRRKCVEEILRKGEKK